MVTRNNTPTNAVEETAKAPDQTTDQVPGTATDQATNTVTNQVVVSEAAKKLELARLRIKQQRDLIISVASVGSASISVLRDRTIGSRLRADAMVGNTSTYDLTVDTTRLMRGDAIGVVLDGVVATYAVMRQAVIANNHIIYQVCELEYNGSFDTFTEYTLGKSTQIDASCISVFRAQCVKFDSDKPKKSAVQIRVEMIKEQMKAQA